MSPFKEYDRQNEEFDLNGLINEVKAIGFPEEIKSWLLPFLQHPDCLLCPLPELVIPGDTTMSDVVQESERKLREKCLAALKTCHDRAHPTCDALVVDIIQSLVSLEPYLFHNIFIFQDEQRAFVIVRDSWRQLLKSLRVDWAQGIRDVSSKTRISFQLGIALFALEDRSVFKWEEMLQLGKAVDPGLVDECRNLRHDGVNTKVSLALQDLIHDPEGFVYWMESILRSGRSLDEETLIGLLESVEAAESPQVLTQIVNACSILRHIQPVRDSFIFAFYGGNRDWEPVLDQMLRVVERVFPETLFERPQSVDLRADWLTMRYSLQLERTSGLTSPRLFPMQDPERQKRWLAVAHEMLGVTRAVLRLEAAEGEARFHRLPLKQAAHIVNEFGSPWRVTKAGLLALRELRTLSTGPDLRYWSEVGKEDPPEPWSDIPSLIADQLRLHRRLHPGEDRMAEVRDQFATYLLERLKSRKDEKDNANEAVGRLTEPDPVWRHAYVRALRELHANPGGRGHHVLYWVMGNDPDPEIREQAKITYNQMRKNEGLPAAISPLTASFAAFWWLRQAHVISLGFDVDQAGASRTRAKEVRRTKEEFQE